MSRRLIVRPEAEAEMADAFDWYEDRVPGLTSCSLAPMLCEAIQPLVQSICQLQERKLAAEFRALEQIDACDLPLAEHVVDHLGHLIESSSRPVPAQRGNNDDQQNEDMA